MSKGFKPLVSIIIPVYNGSNYLRQAINSALSQTYDNLEIIVVNDGSKDNGQTEKIAKSYGDKIKYFKKENGGVATALNLGIEKMSGEYFSWLSHDDVYLPNKIINQVKLINKIGKEKSMVVCNYAFIDTKGKIINSNKFNIDEKNPVNGLNFLFEFQINGCALLVHRDYFIEYDKFKEGLSTTQDYDMWYRILKHNDIYYSNDIDVLSRSHSEQTSKTNFKKHIEECNDLWINIIKDISIEKRIEQYGSEYVFFKTLYDKFRKNTIYTGVIEYIKENYINSLLKLEKEVAEFEILSKINELDKENQELLDRIRIIDKENQELLDRIRIIDKENLNNIEQLNKITTEIDSIYSSKIWNFIKKQKTTIKYIIKKIGRKR